MQRELNILIGDKKRKHVSEKYSVHIVNSSLHVGLKLLGMK